MVNDDNLYELKVGSRFLNNFTILGMSQKPPIPTLDFICDFQETTEFNNLDLKDEVSLVRKSDKNKLFGGHVHDLSYSDRKAVFMCKGGNSFFHNLKIKFEFLNIKKGEKLMWFLSRLAFKKAKINIQDIMLKQVDLTNKEYIFITPVRNFLLTGDLTIGDVTFYSTFDSPEDQIIRASKQGRRESEWKEIPVRARVKVVASSSLRSKFASKSDWMSADAS
jgi:hypothetical protein